MAMKKTMAILLSVLLMLFLAVPTFASSAFFSPASVLSRTLRFDLFSFLQWDMRMIRMPSVWDSGLTGQGVQVGIIDSGISAKNRDLDPDRILPGIDFVSGDNALTDTSGHGTFIAGIIGAARHNGFGISGIAPEATLVSMKTSDHKRSEIHHVADAIRACVDDYQCSVINLSSSSEESSEVLAEAIRYADEKGVIIICPVGNDGNETRNYPAAYEETIGVGAVDSHKSVSSFSNCNNTVFIVAPGEETFSLGRTRYGIVFRNGTSYAAPFVTGLAALLKERYPQMTRTDFCEILQRSSLDLGDEGYDPHYGWGLIQADAALRAADEYF